MINSDTTSIRAADLARQNIEERMAAEERIYISKVTKLEMSLQEKTALLSQTNTALKAAEVHFYLLLVCAMSFTLPTGRS